MTDFGKPLNLAEMVWNILSHNAPMPETPHLTTADLGITELDQPDAEAFFNSGGISHIIVRRDDFNLYGSAATVCGFIAMHGDSYAKYDLCPECAA